MYCFRIFASNTGAAELQVQKRAALRCWLGSNCDDFRSRGDDFRSGLLLWLCSLKSQRHREQFRFAHADVAQRAHFLGFVVDVGSHLSKHHLVAELRVRELRRFFCDDLAHDLSYAVFLGPVYSAVAESYDVDSCKIVVNCSTCENPVDASTSSPDKASEIVSGVFVALEDRICPVACDGGDQEV